MVSLDSSVTVDSACGAGSAAPSSDFNWKGKVLTNKKMQFISRTVTDFFHKQVLAF